MRRRRWPMPLLWATLLLGSLGQVRSGAIVWAHDPTRCLAVESGKILLGHVTPGDRGQLFTTTGMGPIHWVKHPGKCMLVDIDGGGGMLIQDCVDIVNRPEAQFIAMQNGLVCLEDHMDKCMRVTGDNEVRATLCSAEEVECQFNPVAAIRRYARSQEFVDGTFFSKFTFFSDDDPTHGKVEYVDEETARVEGLIHESTTSVYLGADLTSTTRGHGRKSVRIESKMTWHEGLFVVSLEHVPTGCGTWPAMWLLGENKEHPWPQWGEYDIVEGTHLADQVATTLHTGVGCNQQGLPHDFSGHWQMGMTQKSTNCDIGATGQYGNQGCSQMGPKGSMGASFNTNGGGTYAAEWDPEAGYIRTWFWPFGREPVDVQEGVPDPGRWDEPYSFFRLGDMCPASHFRDMRLIFDLTFCGDLGTPTFHSGCPREARTMTCEELVSNHPGLLQGAYWSIRKLDVYNLQRPRALVSTPAPAPQLRRPTSPMPLPHAHRQPVVLAVPAVPQELLPTEPPKRQPQAAEPEAEPPEMIRAVEPAAPAAAQAVAEPLVDTAGEEPEAEPEVVPEVRERPSVRKRPEKSPQDHLKVHWIVLGLVVLAALGGSGIWALRATPPEELPPALRPVAGALEVAAERMQELWQVAARVASEGALYLRAAWDRAWEAAEPVLRGWWAAYRTRLEEFRRARAVQRFEAGVQSIQDTAAVLWATWAPPRLQALCHTAIQACRLQCDSMWEAVAVVDFAEDLQLRKGDQVVVRSPFVAETGTVFGTRLQQNMKGFVEEVEADGTATIQFAGQLGSFPVSVTQELQVHLQVITGQHVEPLLAYRSRVLDWMFNNKRLAFGCGASLVFILLVGLAYPRRQACSKTFLDCRETKFCCDPSHACYEKNEFWAACLPECDPGVHLDEEPQWQSPWTCQVIAGPWQRRLDDVVQQQWIQTLPELNISHVLLDDSEVANHSHWVSVAKGAVAGPRGARP